MLVFVWLVDLRLVSGAQIATDRLDSLAEKGEVVSFSHQMYPN